ncbi:Hypothetical predicted protein [Olea europaea subsp. europaea]|uniref:Uncharacterized protein n=1 Tax=Olea europaea subsp. europaea TaxID=158383 RepID=A0A8S0UH67_OLEEU|nr:Hypothetical predicted protein [Olea europaea subsp. europaea]
MLRERGRRASLSISTFILGHANTGRARLESRGPEIGSRKANGLGSRARPELRKQNRPTNSARRPSRDVESAPSYPALPVRPFGRSPGRGAAQNKHTPPARLSDSIMTLEAGGHLAPPPRKGVSKYLHAFALTMAGAGGPTHGQV